MSQQLFFEFFKTALTWVLKNGHENLLDGVEKSPALTGWAKGQITGWMGIMQCQTDVEAFWSREVQVVSGEPRSVT